MKTNCWEYHKCGRQPGGHSADTLGICYASVAKAYDTGNSGKNAGRCCWRASGTLYGGHADCICLLEMESCSTCEFYQKVRTEEAGEFKN